MLSDSVVVRSFRILKSSDRKKIFVVLVVQIFFGALDLLGVALVGVIGGLAITGVQGVEPGNRVYAMLRFLRLEDLELQTQATLVGLLAAFLLITKTILSVIFLRKTVFFLSRRSAVISTELISKVLSQPLVKIQSRSMQQTLYSVTSGVDSISMGIMNTFVLIISDSTLLVILAVGLFFVDPLVALSTFLFFSFVAATLYRLMQVRAVKLGEELREISIQSSEKALEVLNSYREVVVRNRRNYYASELGKLRMNLANVNAERSFMPNISKYVIEVTIVIGSIAIAAIQFLTNDAAHAFAVLSVFLAASTRISPALLRLQQGAILIKASIGSAGPTLDMIEELRNVIPGEKEIDPLTLNHDGFSGKISIKNLTVKYPNSTEAAVRNVSLEVAPGQVVSFVGPSGAGKTTLIDTILGVVDPEVGEVEIEGMSPNSAIKAWPGAVGYVPQDVIVTNGTIRQNVTLGFSPDTVPDSVIWDALKIAQISDFVGQLPLGLDTHVGDRGAKLSGGQRQRIGIARAMLTCPKLLVLDEATSSLDGVTEAAISGAINALKGQVTILLIAHRLSTVKESDVINYLSNGELVHSGTFEEVRSAIPDFDKQAQLMGL